MTCTIIISHFESVPFLRACVRQIRKYTNPAVSQHIIICDQSKFETNAGILQEYGNNSDITVVWADPLYSGYGLDWIFRNAILKTDYIAQLHVDAFPISDQWLTLPIKLIEEHDLAFVGQLQFISDGSASIYPPSPMFAMAQCFNVGKTEVYKEMSLAAGFTRFHNRAWTENMTWENDEWAQWAAADYQNRGSDDDVVAFSWEDRHREHDKVSLAITGFIEPSYGRLIEDIVFHFGSANEARGTMSTQPQLYQEYTRRINDNYSDKLIEEMVTLARANRPPATEILSRNYWNGKTKTVSPPTELMNNQIELWKK